MKKEILSGLFVCGILFGTVACNQEKGAVEQAQETNEQMAEDTPMEEVKEDQSDFMTKAVSSSMLEVEAGKLAQEKGRDYDRVLKIYPLHFGEIHLAYEKLRTDRISNEFDFAYVYRSYLKGDDWYDPKERNVKGLSVRMTQHYYTSKKHRGTPFGFFHGPTFGYRYLIFEQNTFDLPVLPPSDPDFRYVGRLTQHSLDLGYLLGYQFKLSRHFTTELSLGIGARAKYARATAGKELLTENIIGHTLRAEDNSALFLAPLPHARFALGYVF